MTDFIPLMALILTLINGDCMTVAESWCMAMADISKLEQQARWIVDDDWIEYHCGAKCLLKGLEGEDNA